MKGARVQTTVRVPVSTLVAEVVEAHSIKAPLSSVRLEGDTIILAFGDLEASTMGGPHPLQLPPSTVPAPGEGHPLRQPESPAAQGRVGRRSRRSGQRNRMKTRGWNVVTKTTNSHGQTVTIYEPFVRALQGVKGSRRQKEGIVASILRQNGNKPGPDSIRYYLENTMEYLSQSPGEKTEP